MSEQITTEEIKEFAELLNRLNDLHQKAHGGIWEMVEDCIVSSEVDDEAIAVDLYDADAEFIVAIHRHLPTLTVGIVRIISKLVDLHFKLAVSNAEFLSIVFPQAPVPVAPSEGDEREFHIPSMFITRSEVMNELCDIDEVSINEIKLTDDIMEEITSKMSDAIGNVGWNNILHTVIHEVLNFPELLKEEGLINKCPECFYYFQPEKGHYCDLVVDDWMDHDIWTNDAGEWKLLDQKTIESLIEVGEITEKYVWTRAGKTSAISGFHTEQTGSPSGFSIEFPTVYYVSKEPWQMSWFVGGVD